MKKDLLICIAFHYNPDRLKYLQQVLSNFIDNYKCSFDIIIDTNIADLPSAYSLYNNKLITVHTHTNLQHPFHLVWQHRKHIKDNINNYDVVAYFEDDILLPYDNYLNYLENFKILWPERVPAMIRIEELNGEQFVTDIIEPQKITHININMLIIPCREFTELKAPNNYNAFWIMPAKELKETLLSNFERLHESREHAASYVAWELQKPTMIEIENGVVSEKCYSYHLPNNYATAPESPHAKLKPQNIFL